MRCSEEIALYINIKSAIIRAQTLILFSHMDNFYIATNLIFGHMLNYPSDVFLSGLIRKIIPRTLVLDGVHGKRKVVPIIVLGNSKSSHHKYISLNMPFCNLHGR